MIPVLDMRAVGHYADGSPRYSFHVGFPTWGVKKLPVVCPTAEAAYEQGRIALRAYEARDPYGNMGAVLGVTPGARGGFHPVIVTYHSNS